MRAHSPMECCAASADRRNPRHGHKPDLILAVRGVTGYKGVTEERKAKVDPEEKDRSPDQDSQHGH